MLVTSVLFALSLCIATLLFIWRRNHFNYFKKLGIPGPEPNLIWGNLAEYHSMESYKVLGKWMEKYGNTFGFFNGDAPFVVTNDLDLIEYVFMRNFKNFADRGFTMMTDQMHPVWGKAIIHVGGFEWKNIRSTVSYSMSAAKLKRMMSHLEENADIFIKSLEEYADTGREVHMRPNFEQLSMDYTARGAFGIKEHFQGQPDHPLIKVARSVLRGVMKGPLHMIAQSTTRFRRWMKPFYWFTLMIGEFTFDRLCKETTTIIEMRKKDPSPRKSDILQNLIDAEDANGIAKRNGVRHSNGASIQKQGSAQAIATSATVVFIGGFDTTTTSLCYMAFILAKYPDIQKKLREEVLEALSTSGKLDYETIMQKMKYLGQVVDETLRLYPPGLLFVTRQAKEDFEYNGIKFKAGTAFMVSQYHIQRDPQYWPNAEEFNPERFAPENEALLRKEAHVPFGIGPRNCVGMRLALLNLKYTAARMVQKYRLELGESQMGSMEIGAYGMVSSPGRGPWIKFYRV
ncbi:cytochrome P450 3A14-like isoform X8 [Dermacentor silvarum]|uniref:cytochrome P450 3A14-like isoform X8 n=1 Tax=Dermacentor silvarum TaxID=543639 RepID=UPI002100CB51|nr:cytochrome P450 3A14-like isoform X8 [Dermacentor silvarum]